MTRETFRHSALELLLDIPKKAEFFNVQIPELKHQALELKTARGISSEKIEQLLKLCDRAIELHANGVYSSETYKIVLAIGMLFGRYVEGVESFYSKEEIYEAIESHIENMKRKRPLEQITFAQQYLKGVAQEMATDFWRSPEHAETRLAAMCEIVYDEVQRFLSRTLNSVKNNQEEREAFSLCVKHMPKDALGLKQWLRPVAPQAATRRGRPPKK